MTTGPRVGFVLAHEQFPAPRLVEFGAAAEQAGFDELWTSDHFHPWQDNQAHAGQAWITDVASFKEDKIRNAFFEGARSAGKNPKSMRILIESFVVVGGQAEAEEAAEFWRFVPIGFKEFIDEPDPRKIEQGAKAKLSARDVYSQWLVAEEPSRHVDMLRELADLGATDIFVHSGQSTSSA